MRGVLRVGIDLASAAAVREAIAHHGDRYLTRVYAPEELADCGADPLRLAARFAAKEAALKVLRPADDAVPWNSIRVRRDPAGWVELVLSGPAAALAERAGVGELALSLTHEGDLASAVVVASGPVA